MTISNSTPGTFDFAPSRKRDIRTQFGAICWRRRDSEIQVLLVTTRRTRRWVPPKGWPVSGSTPAQAAATEALEEGGVEGRVGDTCLGIFAYTKEMEGDDLPCIVALFPIKVTKVHDTWPEKDMRKRRWFSLAKAAERVLEPELKRILLKFDPKRA